MPYHVCVLSAEERFARMLCYELEDRGLRVSLATTPESALRMEADCYLVDGDRFSLQVPTGRLIRYGRTLSDAPPPTEQWHRPFSFSLLASLAKGEAMHGLVLLEGEQAVLLDGERIALTEREYACLACLVAAKGAPVSRRQLLEAVWGKEWQDDGVVTVYLHYLRKKLARHGKRMIYAIRDRGYALREGDTP